MRTIAVCLALSLCISGPGQPLSVKLLRERPKLILVIVIDQLRADYLTRFAARFLPPKQQNGDIGGFEYLKSQGAYFPQGQFDLLQGMTGPGHSTILSGAYPYLSGVPLNSWFDTATMKPVYCAQDTNEPTLGATPKKKNVGTSPRNMIATTIGDELKNAGFPSRVVSIALKDRAAIFMGGHRADVAIWMDPETMQWVSSRYYFPKGSLPDWMYALNDSSRNKKEEPTLQWKVAGPAVGLSLDTVPPVLLKELEGFGAAFPHSIDMSKKTAFNGPPGLEITEVAAEKLIEQYQLGRGKATDVLAVGFSSHDYLGHAFGPNSLEMEEMTVADDRVVSKLLNHVRKTIPGGMDNVLVVLTADHGIPPNPDWLKENRMAAGRMDEKKIAEELETHLAKKFGALQQGTWVAYVKELNFYLTPGAIAEKNLERSVVENEVRTFLRAKEGIHDVVTNTDYVERRPPPGMIGRQFMKTYFPGRSGDVIAIPRPFYMSGEDTVMHMTGYKYDSTVPIILAGKHIRSGLYASAAEVVDIAPTLAFLLGVVPPNVSEGKVLSDVLK